MRILMTVAKDMMHKVTGSNCRNGDGPESTDLLVEFGVTVVWDAGAFPIEDDFVVAVRS